MLCVRQFRGADVHGEDFVNLCVRQFRGADVHGEDVVML